MEIDNRPRSMSMKDYLIRVMAVKMMVSEKTIESVINHQFQSVSAAMKDSNSVELSGFGKFYFNKKKALKRLDQLMAKKEAVERTLNDSTISEAKRQRANTMLTNTIADIEYLTSKTNDD